MILHMRKCWDVKTKDTLLLRPQTSLSVGNLDTQNLGPTFMKIVRKNSAIKSMPCYVPFDNGGAVSAANVVGNLGGKGFVMHQEKVDFPDVVDKEFLETVR